MQNAQLTDKHAETMGLIFQQPASHNLEWRDVIAMMDEMGTVEEKDQGHLIFTINHVSRGFHRAQDKNVSDIQQVVDLRHFLKSAENVPQTTESEDAGGSRLLVVINQDEALVFRSQAKNSLPEELHPYDPKSLLHHLKNTIGEDKASHLPENVTYYREIADTVADAREILLMGDGTGAACAMTHFQDYLTAHHPDTAKKIVGALAIDSAALTEGQFLADARAFFAKQDGESR